MSLHNYYCSTSFKIFKQYVIQSCLICDNTIDNYIRRWLSWTVTRREAETLHTLEGSPSWESACTPWFHQCYRKYLQVQGYSSFRVHYGEYVVCLLVIGS